jgi:hypothetical protein
VIAGQPEIAERLNHPSLRQLKQRVALRCDLRPLRLEETFTYVALRIKAAGGTATHVFTREAVELIHEQSRGSPRTINVIADNALVAGLAMQMRPVPTQIVAEVCRDFDIASAAANGRNGRAGRVPPQALAPAMAGSTIPAPDQRQPPVRPSAPAAAAPVTTAPAATTFSPFGWKSRRFSFF